MRCKFGLPSVEAEEVSSGRMPPIKVKFELPYFTVSGIQVRVDRIHVCIYLFETNGILGNVVQVRYLKVVERSGYQALPWVRYITTAGDYELRMV